MMSEKVITRFAPSPTGMLHIGSARTALFNWLYARHCGGKFLLRIEDTDKERSTQKATDQILSSLKWLGLDYDGKAVIQSQRIEEHRAIAYELVKRGAAYYCYMTQDDIERAKGNNGFAKIVSPWRDGQSLPIPQNVKPVIRMKMQEQGESYFEDIVQGRIVINNSELNDMIILRSDDTPTYLLAVVIDDHDMGVTHVIRGDDHIMNTFKQMAIYNAMGWKIPKHTHIPLIHGQDGHKLSKRHGALGVDHYREHGYLSEALCNYLTRLGWGGDGQQEIFDMQAAAAMFDVKDISKAPAKFDLDKLNYINAHYINAIDDDRLFDMLMPFWYDESCKYPDKEKYISKEFLQKIKLSIPLFKTRCNTLIDMVRMCSILVGRCDPLDHKSHEMMLSQLNLSLLIGLQDELCNITAWNVISIKEICKNFAIINNIKEALVMQCLRAAVIGTFKSPGIYEMMSILDKDDCMNRIDQSLLEFQ